MNRKEILKYIGYEGTYTKEVKKKLRELLKKYHPDHYKKEDNTFKLIKEIKKDLDDNKKISIDSNTRDNDINDNYKITEEIMNLTKKRDSLIERKNKYQKELSELQDEYRNEYEIDVNYRNLAVDSTNEIINIQSSRKKYNILLVISTILSVICVFTKWYYALIITLILFGFSIYNYFKIEIYLDNKLIDNKKNIKVSEKSIKKIRTINESMNKIYKKIWNIDCEINRLTTRINLLKAKIR